MDDYSEYRAKLAADLAWLRRNGIIEDRRMARRELVPRLWGLQTREPGRQEGVQPEVRSAVQFSLGATETSREDARKIASAALGREISERQFYRAVKDDGRSSLLRDTVTSSVTTCARILRELPDSPDTLY
jgi:hypothetical protein